MAVLEQRSAKQVPVLSAAVTPPQPDQRVNLNGHIAPYSPNRLRGHEAAKALPPNIAEVIRGAFPEAEIVEAESFETGIHGGKQVFGVRLRQQGQETSWVAKTAESVEIFDNEAKGQAAVMESPLGPDTVPFHLVDRDRRVVLMPKHGENPKTMRDVVVREEISTREAIHYQNDHMGQNLAWWKRHPIAFGRYPKDQVVSQQRPEWIEVREGIYAFAKKLATEFGVTEDTILDAQIRVIGGKQLEGRRLREKSNTSSQTITLRQILQIPEAAHAVSPGIAGTGKADLSLKNVLQNEHGERKIIDNETVGVIDLAEAAWTLTKGDTIKARKGKGSASLELDTTGDQRVLTLDISKVEISPISVALERNGWNWGRKIANELMYPGFVRDMLRCKVFSMLHEIHEAVLKNKADPTNYIYPLALAANAALAHKQESIFAGITTAM